MYGGQRAAGSGQRAAGALAAVVLLGLASASPGRAADEAPAVVRGKTVAQWADQLADQDVAARWYAAYALGEFGPRAAAAVPALRKVLENRGEHEYVRGGAARALGCIGPGAESAVPLLIETLASEHHVAVRRNAAWALGRLGPAARSAVPALRKRLDDADAAVRVKAAVALWQIDRHGESIPLLGAMARSNRQPEAYEAVLALGEVGPEAAATAALVEVLGAGDDDSSRAAARALGCFGPAAMPAIKPLLDAPEETVRRRAVEVLGRMGAGAAPALIHALKDPSPLARAAAARALGRLGPSANEATSALLESLSDQDAQVRATAAWALKQIEKAAGGHPAPPAPTKRS